MVKDLLDKVTALGATRFSFYSNITLNIFFM